jgi:hypothetical protein
MKKYANFNIISKFFGVCPVFYIQKYTRKSPKMNFAMAIFGPA